MFGQSYTRYIRRRANTSKYGLAFKYNERLDAISNFATTSQPARPDLKDIRPLRLHLLSSQMLHHREQTPRAKCTR